MVVTKNKVFYELNINVNFLNKNHILYDRTIKSLYSINKFSIQLLSKIDL